MKNILFIDAAARKDSRTRALAEYLLQRLPGRVQKLSLYETQIPRLDDVRLCWRNRCCAERNFEDGYFIPAKSFAAADIIVVAAPYWDLSFPAVLKQYIEAISVNGITFTYAENGTPIGLCSAEKLYYVTTSGGYIVSDEPGYGYIRRLARDMYGIRETVCIKAGGLDIYGSDIDRIMANARAEIDGLCAADDK